jgi:uncharacterized membrane protein
MFNVANQGWAVVITLLGIYLFVKGFHWEKNLQTLYTDAMAGVRNLKMSLITAFIAILLVIAGIVNASEAIINTGDDIAAMVLIFVEQAIWWIIAAGIVLALGNVVDEWLSERRSTSAWEYFNYLVYFFAVGLIITASVDAIQKSRNYSDPDIMSSIFFPLVVGVILLFVGRYLKNIISSTGISTRAGPEPRGWRK